MDLGLSGKRVLVTGGNSGLGAAIVAAFAAEGARVAVNYVAHPDAAAAIVGALKAQGREALALQADVSDAAAVARMFTDLDTAWQGLDVLVNNAGIDGKRSLSWESTPEDWNRVLNINLDGAYYCAREALRRMVAQRAGVVLNTSSVHEFIAWSGYSAYAASKAALSMMAKTMAQEAGPANVRVLCIAPGAIRTPINAAVWQNVKDYDDLIGKIAMGRLGEPQDIARMAVLLASDAAAYVTGTTVVVDGGMTDYPAFRHGG